MCETFFVQAKALPSLPSQQNSHERGARHARARSSRRACRWNAGGSSSMTTLAHLEPTRDTTGQPTPSYGLSMSVVPGAPPVGAMSLMSAASLSRSGEHPKGK